MVTNLFMSRARGEFDVAAVRSYLDAQPDTFADPHGTDYYLCGGMPEAVEGLREERRQDGTRFPCAVLIEVTPEQVTLVQEFANQYNLRSALEFAKWMWNQGDLVVRDYYGRDVTGNCGTEGIDALYPDWVKNAPIPWAGRLIEVGFFRELDHGDISAPSLEESRADTPTADEDRIVAYLEKAHLLVPSANVAEDWLAEDPDAENGPPHILTDGTYAWPADLPYYVRNYQVRLPKHFLMHVQRSDFQIPVNVDVASLKLE
jgi:hypothetical protein